MCATHVGSFVGAQHTRLCTRTHIHSALSLTHSFSLSRHKFRDYSIPRKYDFTFSGKVFTILITPMIAPTKQCGHGCIHNLDRTHMLSRSTRTYHLVGTDQDIWNGCKGWSSFAKNWSFVEKALEVICKPNFVCLWLVVVPVLLCRSHWPDRNLLRRVPDMTLA